MISNSTAPTSSPNKGLCWWKELVLLATLYIAYSLVRNYVINDGNSDSSRSIATRNARLLIDFERSIGLFVEDRIQGWFVRDGIFSSKFFVQIFNVYYWLTHFSVTVCTFAWVYFRHPKGFVRIRNIGLLCTGLGLIGFAFFPVLPPRLLDSSFGFIDTIKEFGGSISFDSEAISRVSNQYAAMPSIHCAWAIWCAYAIFSNTQNRITRILAVLYPLITLFGITITANHYWIDAVGGAFVFLIAYFFFSRMVPYLQKTNSFRKLSLKYVDRKNLQPQKTS